MAVAPQARAQPEVARQRLEHVLPRSHRLGAAHQHLRAGGDRPDAVGYDPLGRPVAAADHVAGPRTGHAYPGAGVEEAAPVGARNELGASLAGAVGVVPAQGVAFAVGVGGLAVLVALVARDVHHDAHRTAGAHGFEQVGDAHDVGLEGSPRVGVGGPHQRLGREVEDHLRGEALDGRRKRGEVAHVTCDVRDLAAQGEQLEEAGRGRRRQGVAAHGRPEAG